MKIFTFLSAMLFVISSYAQDVKGYYITASGQKTEGFFKEGDFNDTPTLRFKASKNDEYAILSADVVEYGFDEGLKFVKRTVEMDISRNITLDKNPVLESRTMFLNVIVEGKATLYSYTKDYKVSYFFSVEGEQDVITQLINKKYILDNGNTVDYPGFRQQLYVKVKCEDQKVSDFALIMYDRKQLMNVFTNYNTCNSYRC